MPVLLIHGNRQKKLLKNPSAALIKIWKGSAMPQGSEGEIRAWPKGSIHNQHGGWDSMASQTIISYTCTVRV